MTNALADNGGMPSMGSGLAQGGGDMIRLRKIWMEEYTGGGTQLQFGEWLKEQGIKSPVMPR